MIKTLSKDEVFDYNADPLQVLRRQYGLDKPERLEEAISLIEDWLMKQDHMMKKNYSKGYLERIILNSKGSVEKAKIILDKIAISRTVSPQYFVPITPTKTSLLDNITVGVLPKMTSDHCRVFVVKDTSKHYGNGFMEGYRYIVMMCEYELAKDYNNGLIFIFEYTEANLFEIVKSINFAEFYRLAKIATEGFKKRIKGSHFITKSASVDALVTVVKQVLSKKIMDRVRIHKSIEDVYEFIPKEIMPSDFGGQEKSLIELSKDWNAALGSEHFMKYLKEMQSAGVKENYIRDDQFNEEYLGIPGSFRNLHVD